jgi:hypothetical protein
MGHSANRIETVIGRSLAACAHPHAAWQLGSAPVRTWLLVAYFAASYLAIFCVLEFVFRG